MEHIHSGLPGRSTWLIHESRYKTRAIFGDLDRNEGLSPGDPAHPFGQRTLELGGIHPANTDSAKHWNRNRVIGINPIVAGELRVSLEFDHQAFGVGDRIRIKRRRYRS